LRIVDRRRDRIPWKYAWGQGATTLMKLLEERGGGSKGEFGIDAHSSEEERTTDDDDDDSDSSQ
tara:strand:- start:580 stop:771 length:192 start_codon:yes stop_codon:yes gene_type:complete